MVSVAGVFVARADCGGDLWVGFAARDCECCVAYQCHLEQRRLEGVAWVLGDGGLSLNSVKGCSESLEHLGLGRGAVYA
ncbi:hypothetical protein RE2895_60920 (plasmid) [Rhodococcus erythropolis]|nr:hypothetical protein RE2895_60920 [Rhodococcus erythropolis]